MVSFSPEIIFSIGTFPVTNTILHTILVDLLLFTLAFILYRKRSIVPRFFQNLVEFLLETFYNLTESVSQKSAAQIFPYFMSFFLFILLANLTALIPGMGTIGFFKGEGHEKELVPLLRGAASDVNTTLALALVSVVATHMLSVKTLGIKEYLGRYFSLNPLNLFIGALEIISEITKVVSLSFRLFGNIFAGEVVLSKISAIFAFIIPLPFLLLELIVGFVQALVFSMLTMAFMAILTTPHHEAKEVNH